MQIELIDVMRPPSRAGARRAAMTLAKARRDQGIAAAARLNAEWCAVALEALRRFAAAQAGVWTIEMARAVLEPDLPACTDARAWGAVTILAIKREYIAAVPGVFLPAASSNAAPKQAWRQGKGARG